MIERPTHMPADTPDDLAQAWVDCLRWAASSPDVLRDFEAATGIRLAAPRSVMDRAIDDATGQDRAVFEQFVAWFNANVWGAMG